MLIRKPVLDAIAEGSVTCAFRRRSLVAAVGAGGIAATTSTEVLWESTHVRARRHTRDDAADLTEHFARLSGPLPTVDERELHAGLRFSRGHTRIGPVDAVLLATAMGIGATAIVSAGAASADVPGIRHVVPDEAAIAALPGRSGPG